MRWVFGHIRSVGDMALLGEDEFRLFVTDLFRIMGYEVRVLPEAGEYGADLIVTKTGRKTAIRCRQLPLPAGIDTVQEAYFAKGYYRSDQAWAICPCGFTGEAESAAATMGVHLRDGASLLDLMSAYADAITRAQQPEAEEEPDERQMPASSGDQQVPAEPDGSSFSITEENSEELRRYHGGGPDVVIPQDLGIRRIGPYVLGIPWRSSLADKDPGDYTDAWKSVTSVVIPEGVTAIGPNAFKGCSALEAVTLPPTLESIGCDAFRDCASLKSVITVEGRQSEGVAGYEAIMHLHEFRLPASIREIGAGAFRGCSSLWSIAIPSGVETIEADTFASCTFLGEVTFPAGLRSIEAGAFSRCTWLKKVELPSTIEELAPRAFEGCRELAEVTVAGEGCCGRLYRSAFAGCSKLDKTSPIGNLPSTATLVNDTAFPGMFDGPAHQLHALRFEASDSRRRSAHSYDYLIVDRGVEGLNHFVSTSEDCLGAGFCVELDDGCDRGYYAVSGPHVNPISREPVEGYLEANGEVRKGNDPSRHIVGSLMGELSIHLCGCHLVPRPSVDGADALRVVDEYREKVTPLVREFRWVKGDESGRGKKFERGKLAKLDELYALIRHANMQFQMEAKPLGIDCAYYIRACSATMGDGLAPSKEAARRAEQVREMVRQRRQNALADLLWFLLKGCFNGCFVLVFLACLLSVFGMLLMFLFI